MEYFTNQIKKFLLGKLSLEEEAKLLKEIKSSEHKKSQFIAEQAKLKTQIINEADDQTNEELNRLAARLGYQNKNNSRKLWISSRKYVAIAAAFVLGIVISASLVIGFSDFNQQQVMHEVSIPYGAKTNITLPDGSVVWMNSGSHLTYSGNFNNQRKVELEGEAYFEVVKSKSPFSVNTNYGKIEVLGTSFNVKAYKDDSFETTLIEGRVKFSRPGISPVIMKPDQQISINANKLTSQEVDTKIFTAWKDGKLIFQREPFIEVAKKLERWFNIQIDINDNELKDLWFTGTIQMETFSEVMDLISLSLPIQYSYNSKTRTIKIEHK